MLTFRKFMKFLWEKWETIRLVSYKISIQSRNCKFCRIIKHLEEVKVKFKVTIIIHKISIKK